MITVYTSKIINRVSYVVDFVIKTILQSAYQITDNWQEFKEFEGVKINYSQQKEENSIQIIPSNLLHEKEIQLQQKEVELWNEIPVLFPQKGGDLPFDIFAASFYLISRYEEYTNYKRDHYNRFLPEESIAFKNNFLQKPIVDIWAYELKKKIAEKHPNYRFKERKYQFITTIDVDNAYAYLEKGFVRTLGALTRELIQLNIPNLKERISCLLNQKEDPFNTFQKLLEIDKKYELTSIFFFLVADYGLNDKNVPISSKKFQTLIKHIADYSTVAMHPSFASNDEPEKLRIELKRLRDVVHYPVTKSRQHFLKLSFPATYRNLIDEEITDDYTMGYASEFGFRAGTCTPFSFYDLEREQKTMLKVHPFQAMEATLRHYKNIPAKDALPYFKPIIEEIKAVNGTFVCLWHNDSLSEIDPWVGWSSLYEKMVKEAVGGEL